VAGQGPTSQVRVSDAARVADCQFVTSITESYHSGLLFAGTGLKQAQNEVLVAAGRQGATDIVWNSLNSGGVVQSATASAYRCPV
jgi:glutamine cyclotransferase